MDLRDAIIEAFRRSVAERYSWENLRNRTDLPAGFTEQKARAIREFFLAEIYPDPEKRAELERSFDSLDGYLQNPGRLLQLLRDSASLLFKFGRHIPKMGRAGLQAARSFRAGTRFEEQMTAAAAASGKPPPFDTEDLRGFISTLDSDEIDAFIEQSIELFNVLHDRKLVDKILAMNAAMVGRMRARPDVYGQDEINGLETGRRIIEEGNRLFRGLNENEQRVLADFVAATEREFLGL